MLDKTLSSLNKQKFKNKSDFSCQFSNFDNNNKDNPVKNYLNKTTQTVLKVNSSNNVACQINFAEDSLISNENMKKSKSNEINANYVSTYCQTESVLVEKKLSTFNRSVQTSNNMTSFVEK